MILYVLAPSPESRPRLAKPSHDDGSHGVTSQLHKLEALIYVIGLMVLTCIGYRQSSRASTPLYSIAPTQASSIVTMNSFLSILALIACNLAAPIAQAEYGTYGERN